MKQHCHISMIYLSWIVYAGGVMFAVWRASWLFGAFVLIAVPVLEWFYIRNFPKFSAALGYGKITDQPAETAEPAQVRVILYTALGCPFCPLIERRLEELRRQLGFSLEKVDVTLRPDLLAARHILSVPAVEIGDRFFTGLVSSRDLAAAVAQPRAAATAAR